jgi:signal transduction histidine kinase
MTGDDGTIDIHEHVLDDPPEAQRVEIRIIDNGPGMPPAVIEKVFEPFYTTKEDGTGLGLSIVSRIIREHGGQVELASAEDRGTTFSIVLPVI